MKTSQISMPSAWGRNVVHHYVTNVEKSLVVVFPGINYSCERPLLHYAAKSATQHQHDVLLLEYGFQSARTSFDPSEMNILVYECKHAIDQVKDNYETILFVSKSVGTLVAGQVAEIFESLSIRQLFLTPVDGTVPYIQGSRCTVIYGTTDPQFNPESVEAIKQVKQAFIHPIDQANHALERGSLDESIEIMGHITDIYRAFFQSTQMK